MNIAGLWNKVFSSPEAVTTTQARTPQTQPERTPVTKKRSKKRKARKDTPGPTRPTSFKKVIKRKQNVPYVHDVKVPVTTKQLVKTTKKIKVLTTVVEEELDWEFVTEKYTVMEKRKGSRPKEIWVKKVIYEDFEEEIPVTKFRKVRKPVKRFVEKEVECEVEVPSNEVQEVKGFRIDSVEDTKQVEVEEVQEYQYVPKIVKTEEGDRHEGEVNVGDRTKRSLGTKVYTNNRRASVDLQSIPLDETAQDNVLASPTKNPMVIAGEEGRLRPASVRRTRPRSDVMTEDQYLAHMRRQQDRRQAAMDVEQEAEEAEEEEEEEENSANHQHSPRVSPLKKYRHLSPRAATRAPLIE